MSSSSAHFSEEQSQLPHYIKRDFNQETLAYFVPAKNQAIPFVQYSTMQQFWRTLGAVLLFPYTLFNTSLINNDEMGLVIDSEGKPKLLGTGWHTRFPFDTFLGRKKLNTSYIEAGSLKIISVKEGELCYCIDQATGQQKLLTAGRHVIDNAALKCRGFIDLNNPSKIQNIGGQEINVESGDLQIVRVENGQEGVLNRSGKLEILQPGLHVVRSPDKFQNYIATTQQIQELEEAIIESRDNVPLRIKADVFYQVTDRVKALLNFGKDIVKFITDNAKATINSIVRNQSYMYVAQNPTGTYAASAERKEDASIALSPDKPVTENPQHPSSTTPSITAQTVHDVFMGIINNAFKDSGITISNIRIDAMTIASPELSREFAAQAKTTAETQTKLANLQAQASIQNQMAVNAANQKKIEAEADANAIRIQAEAKASAIKTTAEANKESVIKEGQALQAFASSIAEHPIAQKLAALKSQVEALKGAQVTFNQVPPGFYQGPWSLFGANLSQQPIALSSMEEKSNLSLGLNQATC